MRARVDPDRAFLEIVFDEAEEAAAWASEAAEQEGFLVDLPVGLKLFEELRVALVPGGAPDEIAVEIDARVVQVFPGAEGAHRTALQTSEVEALRRLAARPRAAGEGEGASADPAGESEAAAAAVSPAYRIRQMNVSQKMILAMKANRTERQILTRDGSPQVLMGLLSNARIEDKEVLEIVKSPHAASGVLQRVAKDGRWSRNYEIRLAVVKSPKTPPVLAQRLLPSLRKKDLQVLAKSPHVREAVKGAALRLYLKKM